MNRIISPEGAFPEGASPAPYYVTTSIPYVNGAPHIGHALEFAQADAIARYYRLQGDDVRLLTCTDDNSLKNVLAAEREGIPVRDLVDRNAGVFASLIARLGVANDDFIRTSVDARHVAGVRRLWAALERQGDLYTRDYAGQYCVGCEQFYPPEDLEDGRCPEHGTVPELVRERNYFFRLSRYTDQLAALFDSGEIEIVPETRRNEVRAFIARGLEDFSVSRTRARARGWGIEVPGDPEQVLYVWFDALANYITALGYATDDPHYRRYWQQNPRRLHVIGKGILRFHAVYWPAFLLAAGLPLPRRIFVHGYLTVAGRKIGKSLGNAVDPLDLIGRYGADAVRYWLLREVPATADADFTEEKLARRYTADLANDFGNLVQRTTTLLARYSGGRLPAPGAAGDAERRLREQAEALPSRVAEYFERLALDEAAAAVGGLVTAANRYAEETAPWHLARSERHEPLETALYHLAAATRLAAWHYWPFIPHAAAEAHRRLSGALPQPGGGAFGALLPGTTVESGAPLSPRNVT
jgi:methionyl-tRNA synthetase